MQEYVYYNTNTRLKFEYGLAMSCCAYILRYVMAHPHLFPLSRFQFSSVHQLCFSLLTFFAHVLSFPVLGAR